MVQCPASRVQRPESRVQSPESRVQSPGILVCHSISIRMNQDQTFDDKIDYICTVRKPVKNQQYSRRKAEVSFDKRLKYLQKKCILDY